MPGNNNSTFDENLIEQEFAAYIKKASEVLEAAHDEGRLIYATYLYDVDGLENKALRENVRTHWQRMINVFKERNCLAHFNFGYTDSSYFENSLQYSVLGEFYPEYKELLFQRRMTYILKTGSKPSDALEDLLFRSKTLVDCQTSISIIVYYALYLQMKDKFTDGKEKFDLLFGSEATKIILSKFNPLIGMRLTCCNEQQLLAPFNPLANFIDIPSAPQTKIKAGMYVYFQNAKGYLLKHTKGVHQGEAAFCVEEKPEMKFYSLSMGSPKTENEVRKILLDSYNQDVPEWYKNIFNAESRYPKHTCKLSDIPTLAQAAKSSVFYTFNIKEIIKLFESIKQNKFSDYLENLKTWITNERKEIAAMRLEECKKRGFVTSSNSNNVVASSNAKNNNKSQTTKSESTDILELNFSRYSGRYGRFYQESRREEISDTDKTSLHQDKMKIMPAHEKLMAKFLS